ncbi:hypothetical protein BJV82DRAFT_158130 [Fennellomyces sp. T-0311]|nr:hypothetical protein BJV82DRAFT_158130 [Fennellomyces sp. T-0311]
MNRSVPIHHLSQNMPIARFFCPYQDCVCNFAHRSLLYGHIRTHYAEFFKIKPGRGHRFTTESGEILHFDKESCRNMLKPGDPILVEYVNSEGAAYYCPYKGCTRKTLGASSMHMHIKCQHYRDLPPLGIKKNSVYATEEGKTIAFDESCCNLLEENQPLVVIYQATASYKDVKYCPYKNCKYSTQIHTQYKHIRKEHDANFPKLKWKRPRIFIGPSGNSIVFDKRSRNTVAEGEKITVTDLFGRPL